MTFHTQTKALRKAPSAYTVFAWVTVGVSPCKAHLTCTRFLPDWPLPCFTLWKVSCKVVSSFSGQTTASKGQKPGTNVWKCGTTV